MNCRKHFKRKVGREGLEPSRPCSQEILSLQCLPFHHRPLLARGVLGCDDMIVSCLSRFVNHLLSSFPSGASAPHTQIKPHSTELISEHFCQHLLVEHVHLLLRNHAHFE